MGKNSLVMFHQGWTDIIMCIGLVYYNLEKYNEVVLLIRKDSEKLINFIFRNQKKLQILFLDKSFLDELNYRNNIVKYFKKEKFDINFYGPSLDKKTNFPNRQVAGKTMFYTPYNINGNVAIDNFIIHRDLELENKKYIELINKIGKKYNIIFKDHKRNLSIDESKIINKSLPLFNISNCSEICFDMIKILEEAQEIHILSTFWSLIIYNLQKKNNLFSKKNIFFHNSSYNSNYLPLYENNDWVIC